MSDNELRVLLVGAAGVFGRRLAERLAAEPGVTVILAGRTRRRLEALGGELGAGVEIRLLDREQVTAGELRGTGAAVVIDAAGPFQGSGSALVEAAIDAGLHYIDLADGRAFVSDIRRYGAAAHRAGVAVISGASSTPALSHAVLDRLVGGWRRIDAIRVAISPGNRSPRGRSVVRAILSWAGQPVHLFRDGGWTTAPGWGAARRMEFPGLGTRLVSLCETPDLDLLAERYQPRIAAEFLAGLELGILHRSLHVAGLAVQWGWLRSLAPLAGPARLLSSLLAPFGGDRGGMAVEVSGVDGGGQPVIARWSLAATGGRGPYVPTLAALALVRRIRDGELDFRGASPCVGLLTLEDFRRDFERLEIETRRETVQPPAPVFERALGPRFAVLPPVTQAIHRPDPALLLEGAVDVEGAESWAGRQLARLMGFPGDTRGAPLRVTIEARPDGTECWSRVYPGRVMRSVMARPDAAAGTVEEQFGSLRFRLRLEADETGLTMTPTAAWWRAVRLPLWLLPHIAASERADGERHLFDVAIALPLIGRLVHYRGYLAIRDQYPSSSSGKALKEPDALTGVAGCR